MSDLKRDIFITITINLLAHHHISTSSLERDRRELLGPLHWLVQRDVVSAWNPVDGEMPCRKKIVRPLFRVIRQSESLANHLNHTAISLQLAYDMGGGSIIGILQYSRHNIPVEMILLQCSCRSTSVAMRLLL